jgi:hypothetical protein
MFVRFCPDYDKNYLIVMKSTKSCEYERDSTELDLCDCCRVDVVAIDK